MLDYQKISCDSAPELASRFDQLSKNILGARRLTYAHRTADEQRAG
jgi:hypothetical protein